MSDEWKGDVRDGIYERSNLAYVGSDDAPNNSLRKGPIKRRSFLHRAAPIRALQRQSAFETASSFPLGSRK